MSEENGPVDTANPAPEANEAPAPAAEAPAPTAEAPGSVFTDPALAEYAQGKGFTPDKFESVVKSYKHVEGLIKSGRIDNMVELPALDADEAALGDFYNKLGRPEEPSGYVLPTAEGDDGAMAEWASGVFHEAGLTSKQAAMVAEKWNDHIGSLSQAVGEHEQQSAADAEAELKRDWGAAYDQKVAGIETTAVALGIQHEQLLGLRDSMGPAAAMKFVDQLASKLGEDTMVNGESAEAAHTPAAAIEAMNAMWGDPETSKALMDRGHPQHKAMVAKKSALAQQAAAGRG